MGSAATIISGAADGVDGFVPAIFHPIGWSVACRSPRPILGQGPPSSCSSFFFIYKMSSSLTPEKIA
jgi:hypothetical protein